jgi:DNA-binding NarL/FixJ family response regulator
MDGDPMAAAELWAMTGSPYEIAIALAHSDQTAQLEALEVLDALGASAVAAKLTKALRDQGVSAPRGKSRTTRDHAAGLTASQAEVLQLLDEGLSNTEIADRLFVSPRTIENHVSAVLAKLDSNTRQEAVTRAHTEGLLTTTTPQQLAHNRQYGRSRPAVRVAHMRRYRAFWDLIAIAQIR